MRYVCMKNDDIKIKAQAILGVILGVGFCNQLIMNRYCSL